MPSGSKQSGCPCPAPRCAWLPVRSNRRPWPSDSPTKARMEEPAPGTPCGVEMHGDRANGDWVIDLFGARVRTSTTMSSLCRWDVHQWRICGLGSRLPGRVPPGPGTYDVSSTSCQWFSSCYMHRQRVINVWHLKITHLKNDHTSQREQQAAERGVAR